MLPQDLFEVSIAVQDDSRILVSGNTLTIKGEVVKGTLEKSSIPVRFIVRSSQNEPVAEFIENMKLADKLSFEKTLVLPDNLPRGRYTVSIESSYGSAATSFSDSFQIGETPSSSDKKILEKILPDKKENGAMQIITPLALGILFGIAGIVLLFRILRPFLLRH